MEETEIEYVLVDKDKEPTNENNFLASPVAMSTGEANFCNKFLEINNSNQTYKPLQGIES